MLARCGVISSMVSPVSPPHIVTLAFVASQAATLAALGISEDSPAYIELMDGSGALGIDQNQ